MRPHSRGCPAGPKRLSRSGSDKSVNPPHLCRSRSTSRRNPGNGDAGLVPGWRINSQVIGASEAANPAEAGRIAAGWCPRRAMVRRSSWPGWRRRASGGVMATGNQVVPGAPASAEHAAAGPPETAEHVAQPDGPHATWPVTPAQAAARTASHTVTFAGPPAPGRMAAGTTDRRAGWRRQGSGMAARPPGSRCGSGQVLAAAGWCGCSGRCSGRCCCSSATAGSRPS